MTVDQPAEPVAALLEFRVTFGQKHAYEEHPTFELAHPDGWLTVMATRYGAARAATYRELGHHWANLYTVGARGSMSEAEFARYFPRGELARITATSEDEA